MADVVSKLREQVTCTICHDYFDTPKMLPCLHRFCKACLADYIKSKDVTMFGVTCPECRHLSKPQNWTHSMTKEQWAENFQTDFVIASICEELREGVDTCPKHPKQQVLAYCHACELCICFVCATVEHRRCERVVPLEEAADSRRRRYDTRVESLKEGIRKAEERVDLIENEQSALRQMQEDTEKSVKKEFAEVRSRVDQEEKKIYCRLSTEFANRRKQLDRKEKGERRRINESSSAEMELTRLINMRSDMGFMETSQRQAPKRTHLEEHSDAAIIPGTYTSQIHCEVKIARLDEIGKHLENILPRVLR
ncbi:tripartite motif-containing protein 3-like [Haliotis cracherodii]|uniref:tripartite motif-containing protein 3-like n=1 Tax=Haliotis cracherodii TaxID=6455 RepID=UPI0039EB6C8D